jgi:predicted nucleic acid-binding protein
LIRFVVDASVAVKWVLPEIHSGLAERLLGDGSELWAPDLVWAEVGNIVWKRWRKGEISPERARAILEVFSGFPLQIYSSETLSRTAWGIAHTFNRSFYDSLYLALAIQEGCLMVTADRRLYNAVGGASSKLPILWIEDLPKSP